MSATFGAYAACYSKPIRSRWRKLIPRVRLVVVIALYIRPAGELGSNMVRLKRPTAATNLRYNSVELLTAPRPRSILVGFSVKHEGIHWSFDLSGYLACCYLPAPFLGRPVDVCFNVDNLNQ
jgi:hypothetical protein